MRKVIPENLDMGSECGLKLDLKSMRFILCVSMVLAGTSFLIHPLVNADLMGSDILVQPHLLDFISVRSI